MRTVELMCTLPGGLLLGDRRYTEVVLRPLSGHEEDWLAAHGGTPSALVVTRLLSSCIVWLGDVPPHAELARDLLVGDRDYLMLQLRRLTLGETVWAVLPCPRCGEKMDITFAVNDVPIEPRPQTTASYTWSLHENDERRRTVRFRLPTGADQEAVVGLSEDEAVSMLLQRCFLDDGGLPLSAEEQTTVIDTMDRLAPQIDLELDLRCPECGHTFTAPFDLTTFFCTEMQISAANLLREVHLLAYGYHWREADILELTRARRRAYLALLGDMTRVE